MMAAALLVLAALASAPAAVHPETAATSDVPREPERVLILAFEVKDQGVNAADDAEIAEIARQATRLFRRQVEDDERYVLAEGGGSADGSTASTPARSRPCRTQACLQRLAREAGATRIVRGRYVKVSNLIRYLAVELVDPTTGRVLRSAAAELKGQRDEILDRAVANLYGRLHPLPGRSGARAGE